MTQQVTPLDTDPFDGSRMGLLDHLTELRNRMIWIVGSLLFGVVASMAFVETVIAFITEPVTNAGGPETVANRLIAIGPTDTIFVFFKVMFVMGVIVAMPVLVYQIVAFIAPGLYSHEKRSLFHAPAWHNVSVFWRRRICQFRYAASGRRLPAELSWEM